ncbi:MAG: tetratricopeptide repeat protein [Thermodesulfobacteriota bacterium]
MKSKLWCTFLAIVVGLMSVGSHSFAADCMALKKTIKMERDLKKKRKMISEAIIQCPEDPVFNYKYALSLERFRKYEKALSYYQKAILYNPKMAKAYIGMGDVYVYQGLLDEAINAYRKGVSLMPGDERAASRLARLEIKRKAMVGEILTVSEVLKVMDQMGKISTNMPLLLIGPALQYNVAFVEGSNNLLPTGIRQLGAVGQALQNDALHGVRFEIATHVESALSSLSALEDSKGRAQMIKDQLVTNFQVDPKRLDISWHGDTLPLELSGGGKLNERVEVKRIRE